MRIFGPNKRHQAEQVQSSAQETAIADLQRRVAALEARQRRRRPRDDEDLEVLRAVIGALERLEVEHVSHVSIMRFTATAICRHANVDSDLRIALENGDWDPRSLGLCFSRCEQRVINGHVLVRVGLTNEGWAWKFLSV